MKKFIASGAIIVYALSVIVFCTVMPAGEKATATDFGVMCINAVYPSASIELADSRDNENIDEAGGENLFLSYIPMRQNHIFPLLAATSIPKVKKTQSEMWAVCWRRRWRRKEFLWFMTRLFTTTLLTTILTTDHTKRYSLF